MEDNAAFCCNEHQYKAILRARKMVKNEPFLKHNLTNQKDLEKCNLCYNATRKRH